MGLFLRIFQHLLPDAVAWRLKTGKKLTEFFGGLSGAPSDARDFVDRVHLDLFPDTTRALPEWEEQFGLVASGVEGARRLNLDAAWKATGGQSPRYLQDVVRAAGFDVYVHEWWVPETDPRQVRDPRDHTNVPLFGTVQCGEPLAQCGETTAQANRFLANEPRYLVNLNLTPVAPPAIPDDQSLWPFFVYFGAETFGEDAEIVVTRRAEFERLLLRICPAHLWIVTMVTYTQPTSQTLVTESGDTLITEEGDVLLTEGS